MCGDPGIQYHDNINRWHTSANTAPINASNPCSEYMYLDDSACNLASLNLMKFVRDDGEFDVEGYKHAVRIVFTAQEIIVDNASYPTPRIGENSRDFRPIGLGYANLGALLMNRGLAYDSDAGRAYSAPRSPRSCRRRRRSSPRGSHATRAGRSPGYAVNREPYLKVMNQHRDAAYRVDRNLVPTDLLDSVLTGWDEVVALGEKAGFRNGQLSVLAPTGTIAFMMDCDTTGVEPDIALVKYKRLVGGGYLKIVNQSVTERAAQARLRRAAGGGDRRLDRRARDDRGRPAPQARAPRRLRLRLQAGQRHALDPLQRPPQDDGRGPALHLRRHQQDGEHAGGLHRGGDRQGLHRRLEAGPQGHRGLPRQLASAPSR